MPSRAKTMAHDGSYGASQRFGEEITNELVDWFNAVDATYRSDLRELNEQIFARFMASVDQRFAEADVRLERRFARVDAHIADFRAEMLKWMFIYWSGTVVSIAALLYAMLKR